MESQRVNMTKRLTLSLFYFERAVSIQHSGEVPANLWVGLESRNSWIVLTGILKVSGAFMLYLSDQCIKMLNLLNKTF